MNKETRITAKLDDIPQVIDRLCAMLQNMGSAGWAAFPQGTQFEIKSEGQKSGRDTPQGDLLDRADKQCDLLVLGQTLTTDTGGMSHGMAHQPADTAISIGEWMDIVEPVVGCGHGDEASGFSQACKVVAFGEVVHEIGDACAGRRYMASDRNVVFSKRVPLTRLHREVAASAADA